MDLSWQCQLRDDGIKTAVAAALEYNNDIRSVTFDRVKAAVRDDPEMVKLLDAIMKTPAEENFPPHLAGYNKLRESLSVLDGIPMYGRRIIIPPTLRGEVIKCLHSAHQGISKMNERALQTVYWPSITTEIVRVRQGCDNCNKFAPSQPALSPQPLATPEYPFQMIVGDYFDIKGRMWLVMAD